MKTRHGVSGWGMLGILIVAGVLGAAAIIWMLAEEGATAPRYVDSAIAVSQRTETLLCKQRLLAVGNALGVYARDNGGNFPPDLATLVDKGELPPLALECPGHLQQPYGYVPGQTTTMDGGNVLVYEPRPDHAGASHVLLIGGSVQELTPAELKAALIRTRLASDK